MKDGKRLFRQHFTPGTASKTIGTAKTVQGNDYETS